MLSANIEELPIRELIRRRRRQILVHSIIYYRLNTNLIPDKTFDMWCRELVRLQKEHPEVSKSLEFYKDFKDFDGTTGYDLPSLNDPRLLAIAQSLIKSNPIEPEESFIVRQKNKIVIKF